jgi:hypothetical protein
MFQSQKYYKAFNLYDTDASFFLLSAGSFFISGYEVDNLQISENGGVQVNELFKVAGGALQCKLELNQGLFTSAQTKQGCTVIIQE